MCAAVVARNQHQVVSRPVRRAYYLIANACITQSLAAFQAYFAQREKFLFPFYFKHLHDSHIGETGKQWHQT